MLRTKPAAWRSRGIVASSHNIYTHLRTGQGMLDIDLQ